MGREIDELNEAMKAAGFVLPRTPFNPRRVRNSRRAAHDRISVADGPYLPTTEHVGAPVGVLAFHSPTPWATGEVRSEI